MARRKKGNPVHGWLVIDKPVGIGSTPLVGKARWAFRAQKTGHAGTLDPLASGALAIAFGEATKTVPFVMEGDKRYEFTVRWGAATATDDLEGGVIRTSEERPSHDAILAALPGFRGDIMQVPPLYSAIKVDGERAYDLARAGEHPVLAARALHVTTLDLLEANAEEARFALTCGKGGYVRSIARDLGEVLGCYGHVVHLRRLSTGPFDVVNGVDPDTLDAVREGEAVINLLPVSTGLASLARVDITDENAIRVRLGNSVPVAASLDYGEICWAANGPDAVAIGRFGAGEFHPRRVLAPQT